MPTKFADQKPQSFDQICAIRRVGGEQFGADTRNGWFFLRGFRAQQDAMFLDGLALFNTAFATWKLQPFALERVEVLRGPSSVLYGGGLPGGIVNAVSNMPTAGPICYIETGVNSFGNGYVAFDVGYRSCSAGGRHAGRSRCRRGQGRRYPGRFHRGQQLLPCTEASPIVRTSIPASPFWRWRRKTGPTATSLAAI